jgi:adenine phosphoribosyltransferase
MKRIGDIRAAKYIQDNLKIYKDWPKPGINYLNTVDICRDPDLFWHTVQWYNQVSDSIDARAIFAADARGFLWGAPVAFKRQLALHVVRKKGKMPGDLISREYELEYGTDTLEVARVNKPHGTVLIVDDVLATGGTAEAICKLLHEGIGIEYKNMVVATLLNITFLPGEKKLNDLGVGVVNLIDVNE